MAVEIEYEKRSIWRNVFDPGAWQNLLSGVGEVAGDVASTWEQIEKTRGTVGLEEPEPQQITLADLKFTPNVTLIAIGVGLLALALMMRKK
ncbi:hypothetical protein ES703_41564 [subsurface metagenome]